jgi:hypothetical protein
MKSVRILTEPKGRVKDISCIPIPSMKPACRRGNAKARDLKNRLDGKAFGL